MNEDKLDIVIEKLDKLIFWLKFNNLEAAKEYFAQVLSTDRKKEIYQLTDGSKSIADLMKLLDIKSKSMIPDLYSDWISKGILIESPKIKDRKMKVVDLKELGL
jgi:hypothetical protein